MIFVLMLAAAYLIGSMNIAIGLFRLLGKEDPRGQFSGNPGMTNVYRQAGIGWALVVLLLESGKAVLIATISLRFLVPHLIPWIALGLIIGNLYPCFHRFQGGKGVANLLGFVIPVAPLFAIIAMIQWPLVYKFSRQPFIGSFIMVLILSVGIIIYCDTTVGPVTGTVVTAAAIYYAHRSNIKNWLAEKGFFK